MRYLLILFLILLSSPVRAGELWINGVATSTSVAAVTSGTIDGATIGATTPSTGDFTALTSNTIGVVQSVTISTDADPLTPTVSESRVLILLTCDDSDPTPVTLTKGGSEQNYSEVVIYNVGTKGCSFSLETSVLQVPFDPLLVEQYESITVKYVVDRWAVIAYAINDLALASLAVDGAIVAGGTITGLNKPGADITGAVNHNTTDLHGVIYVFTAAATVTLDAAADVGFIGCAAYRVRDAAEAAILDLDGSEKFNLDGTALAAGTGITATGAGEKVTICTSTDTDGSGTDGYVVWSSTAGWASQ